MTGIQGNGSLGPLDLFADIPMSGGNTGFLHTHVLAMIDVTTAVSTITSTKGPTKGDVLGHVLKVTVTDAGDPVAGAAVTADTKHDDEDPRRRQLRLPRDGDHVQDPRVGGRARLPRRGHVGRRVSNDAAVPLATGSVQLQCRFLDKGAA